MHVPNCSHDRLSNSWHFHELIRSLPTHHYQFRVPFTYSTHLFVASFVRWAHKQTYKTWVGTHESFEIGSPKHAHAHVYIDFSSAADAQTRVFKPSVDLAKDFCLLSALILNSVQMSVSFSAQQFFNTNLLSFKEFLEEFPLTSQCHYICCFTNFINTELPLTHPNPPSVYPAFTAALW